MSNKKRILDASTREELLNELMKNYPESNFTEEQFKAILGIAEYLIEEASKKNNQD